MDSKRLPDKTYLLTVLSTLNPKHFIFHKDYMPPPREKKETRKKFSLANSDGFFDNMSQVQNKFLSKRVKRQPSSIIKHALAFEEKR